MKKLLIAIVCLFALQNANAQITGGIKLGLSTNDVTEADVFAAYENNSTDSLKVSLTGAKVGLHGGVFVRIPLSKLFYVQVEPLVGSSRFNYTLDSISAGGVSNDLREGYESFVNLDLKLIAGVQVGLPADIKLRAHAGLVPSIVLSNQSELWNTDTYTSEWNNMKFGYLLGAGLDFGSITVDVNFVNGLGDFGNDVTVGTNSYQLDTRPKSTVVTVGYKLFGKE
jgi:hypothetical protein